MTGKLEANRTHQPNIYTLQTLFKYYRLDDEPEATALDAQSIAVPGRCPPRRQANRKRCTAISNAERVDTMRYI